MDRSIKRLAGSASGRWQPEETDHTEEGERMRDMDRAGADADAAKNLTDALEDWTA